MQLQFDQERSIGCTATAIDTVQNVLTGKVPTHAQKRWIDASSFAYGFEIGAVDTIESLGEMVAFGTNAYCKSTATYQLTHATRFLTTGAFTIPNDAIPTVHVTVTKPGSCDELYQLIYNKLHAPFAIAGILRCAPLAATAISRAPIYNEPILLHRKRYYEHPPLLIEQATLAVVGLAADFSSPIHKKLNHKLTTALYVPPDQTLQGLTTHTHLLLLKRDLDDIKQVRPEDGIDVLHLFPHSTVIEAHLDVFRIDGVTNF